MNTKTVGITVGIIALLVLTAGLTLSQTGASGKTAEADDHQDEQIDEYEIYPGDVADKIQNNEDIVLLDVRTPEEYEQVHIENALLLPVQELSQQSLSAIGLGEDAKDREIIIYCRSGARSKTAYDIMKSLGYTNLKSVQGGMIHWEEDKYPYTEVGAYTEPQREDTAAAAPVSLPRLMLDRTTHDFGLIPQYGGTVSATFTVRNSGTEDLVVGTLSTSCACTKAELSKSTVAPGDEAVLTVTFDPDLHEEPRDAFKRTVFVPSNDPNTPEAEITITVDIDEGK